MNLSARKGVFTLVMVLCAMLSNAQQTNLDSRFSLVVWLHDGGKVSFPLDEHPVVTCSDGNIVVLSTNSRVEYAHALVRKFTLFDEDMSQGGETTGMTALDHDSQWHRQGDMMLLSDCNPGENVEIYNSAGQLVAQYAIPSDGALLVPFSQLDEGMYVVKIQSITYKFMKK